MTQHQILIVAKQATVRSGLALLMEAIPGVGGIDQARGIADALQHAGLTAPDLLLLDAGEGDLDLLASLKSICPSLKSLLLVDDMRQQTQAQVAGADVALIKGYPARELIETVEVLLAK
jgi:DNA-binding NarL/FixJ family response regulator